MMTEERCCVDYATETQALSHTVLAVPKHLYGPNVPEFN